MDDVSVAHDFEMRDRELKNHRMPDWFELEGTSNPTQSHLCHRQEHLSLGQFCSNVPLGMLERKESVCLVGFVFLLVIQT